MIGVQLEKLVAEAPAGVEEALALADGFDDALVHGLARMNDVQAAAVAALAGALGASPLGPAAAEAAAKIASGSVSEEHLVALAGARTAVFGAVHDALLAHLDGALGRERDAWEAAPQAPSGDALAGSRSWLQELAITGWRGVGDELVSAADQTLETLWDAPATRGTAMLLDGLAAELRAASPIATMDVVPARRWADLWARALLARPVAARPAETVSGRLLPLGVEVQEHGTAVQMVMHAVLETGGATRLVRTSVAAPKVDTIVGPAVWRLLHRYPLFLKAVAEHRCVEVTGLPLTAGGDLLWSEEGAAIRAATDPFVTARVQLAQATAPAVPPLDRHPVRIAEPVLLEDYSVADGVLTLHGHGLALDLDRLPAGGSVTPELVAASTACIGLLRWDGRWSLQVLGARGKVKRTEVEAHNGDWAQGPTDPKVLKAEARTGDAVAVLRERAGRLLRK
ncbi:hypothetical protein [Actinomadura hibisca]|uniref:hypothetical protein n=1 Tax=Actinomadura hibisca TaxID=68565 RepID=UPI0008304C40|nr:hypothetical protein [Actinomadura hibisca]